MASVKLDLVQGIWQDIGAIAFVGTKGSEHNIELVNADSLPSGNIDAAMQFMNSNVQSVPSPAAGNWYIRTTALTGVFKYTEV